MSKRTLTKHKGVYQRESSESIFKGKPDLCYDIAYRVDGKLIWEKIGWLSEGYSAKLASDIRSQRMQQIRHGEELPKEKKKAPFFQDVAEKYFTWGKDNLSEGGRYEQNRYDNHLKDFLYGKRLNEITGFDLERLKQSIKKKGLADQSVKHVLVLFRCIFNKAVAWGLHEGQNPIKSVKMPVPQNQRERFLTHEEAAMLLDRLKEKSPLWHDITLIALHTGLRASEIFSLRGYDLDFDQELVNVDDTKNKHPRKAFMTQAVKDILMSRNPEIPSDLVFKNRKGERITEVSRTVDRTVDELGFNQGIDDTRQKVVFHSLRHTFASNLAIQGTPLHVIAELTGHRQIAMVQRYSHLSPDVKRTAIKQMESGFDQSQNEKFHIADAVK
jgi:integrase